MPGRRLPPLNSLRAFEAAARHQSLSRAAQELSVTHGAISRQVAKLEEFLDVKLFERRHQQVILTKRGAAYAARLQVLFDEIHEATVKNFETPADQDVLRIGVLPTFAIRFLVPRLAKFKRQYPALRLEVNSSQTPLQRQESEGEVDVAVLLGTGNWPHLISEHIFPEELLPVASPDLIAGHDIRVADDLEPFLLLHALYRPHDWKRWLDSAGATRVDPLSGLRLEYSGLVYQGAIDGLGVAVAQPMFIHDDVVHRRLVPLFPNALRTERGYYITYPRGCSEQPKVRAFIGWLENEVAELRRAWHETRAAAE